MIQVIDTETTGLDPGKDAICELAVVPLTDRYPDSPGVWQVGPHYATLVNPGRPIPPAAMAVHHIRDRDVAGAPTLAQAWGADAPHLANPDYFAAHYAEFDERFLECGLGSANLAARFGVPWICTYRVALHLHPEAPTHSCQGLRYVLGLDDQVRTELDRCAAGTLAPHRALYDAVTTAVTLRYFLRDHTPGELVGLTNEPVVLQTVRFGKHSGQLWSSVPHDYLRWILRQSDFDGDVVHTARHYLGE